jgi:hypothetical protein
MIHGGGRAGPHEWGWIQADYEITEVEPLRLELLAQNDYGQVHKAMQQVGVKVSRALLRQVKRYNFDSPGLGFVYKNYRAWRNLATGKGTIGDAAYLVHEIAEVEAFQQVKGGISFDFMKSDLKTAKQLLQWQSDFDRYYLECHSKALEAEYEFIADQVFKVTNGRVNISFLHAAAIEPTRPIGDKTEDMEAFRYMLVNGMPLKRHPHFAAWRRKANEIVPLGKGAQQQLGYYRKKITLENLIRYLKLMPIN